MTPRADLVAILLAVAGGCRSGRGGAVDSGGQSGAVVMVRQDGATSLLIGYFGAFATDTAPEICPGGGTSDCCIVPRGIGLPVVSPLLFPEDQQFQNAGLLAVTDGTTSADLGTVTPGANGHGAMYQSGELASWANGDVLSVTAGGGVFPAFDWSVQSPAAWSGLDLSIVSAAAGATSLTVPATSDFTITWTPESSLDDVIVGAAGIDSSTSMIECYGLQSDGHLTFPAALLAGQGQGAGSLSLFRTHWKVDTDNAGATVSVGASLMLGMDASFH